MPISFEDNDPPIRVVRLTGRLDIPGTAEVETKFAASARGDRPRSIVDLTGVSFLASIGIRAIISTAKAYQQRGGMMVLYTGDNQAVTPTIQMTGITQIIPTFSDLDEARAALLAIG